MNGCQLRVCDGRLYISEARTPPQGALGGEATRWRWGDAIVKGGCGVPTGSINIQSLKGAHGFRQAPVSQLAYSVGGAWVGYVRLRCARKVNGPCAALNGRLLLSGGSGHGSRTHQGTQPITPPSSCTRFVTWPQASGRMQIAVGASPAIYHSTTRVVNWN